MRCKWWMACVVVTCASLCSAAEPEWLTTGNFQWLASDELVRPVNRPQDPCFSMKDPTVVFHGGKWHLFCTIRSKVRTHQIEYLSFTNWKDADHAERHVLKMHGGYFCAPQVFYFTPHRKWYLICQASDESWEPKFQPVFSTSDDISDPASWTALKPLYQQTPNVNSWIDFWVICDERDAYLFYTSLDGKMWRAQTPINQFPHGWSKPVNCLEADIFEASHTYKLKGRDQYLTLIEAQDSGRRYFKAYLATALNGEWRELAASRRQPFASLLNATFTGRKWTDSISHGELLRAGYDEKLEVDPANLRFLFQGALDSEKTGKRYGEIPWRLGILELQRDAQGAIRD